MPSLSETFSMRSTRWREKNSPPATSCRVEGGWGRRKCWKVKQSTCFEGEEERQTRAGVERLALWMVKNLPPANGCRVPRGQ